MKSTDIPVKIPLPWATNDASVVAPTPLNPTGPGRGSWTLGFTSLNMLPLASGGVPPFGQDMNGVLQAISAWGWWAAAGGQVRYDNVFSTENGGYPLGAYLQSADHLGWWMSLVDDNATDPDSGGSNWGFVPFEQSYNGDPNTHVAGNAASAGKPPNTVWDYKNSVFWICTTTGNAAGAVWVPLSILIPVNPSVTGASNNYVAADLGSLRVRSNGGTVMSDTLPTVGSVGNGWWVPIFNKDGVGILTLTAPGSTKLNGVTAGSVAIGPARALWLRQMLTVTFGWLSHRCRKTLRLKKFISMRVATTDPVPTLSTRPVAQWCLLLRRHLRLVTITALGICLVRLPPTT
jgi:hypothetical protein